MNKTRRKDLLSGLILGIAFSLFLVACDSSGQATFTPQAQAQATTLVNSAPAGTAAQTFNSAAVPLAQTGGTINPTGNYIQDVRNVIKASRPAVVLIAAEIVQNGNDFSNIFGGGQQIEQGVGSGSIITPDGYILTNNHVVEGATKLTVALPDGRTYPGKLIGREGKTNDMAIVKIDPKQGETLPTIPIGDSSKLEVGDAVVAIGNALGLEGGPTVTAGIVGAIGRSIEEPGGAQLTDLIQTDAAINPGNSGGPLLNLRGELIGMNTAAPVDPNSGGAAQGIGFAISINQIRPLADGFVKGQPVQRPFMGIVPQALTSALQARYQLPTNTGILIGRVDANSPAARAGWKAGDTIVKMDGKDLRTLNDLSAILQAHKPGDRVNTTLLDRTGKQREAPITFGTPPAQG